MTIVELVRRIERDAVRHSISGRLEEWEDLMHVAATVKRYAATAAEEAGR
ncbi:hypothetical protein GCM10007416_31440 [Kroppenstedtia guangzhouensis]|uniref:Uncharacterized protein n=1 Tax=Kroppenstedtia guangzhouensis TaxID=1274356 RepID=A0ABQ1H3A1_9BACL|nr:hypothetical protein [Kroppenstedtia guangzhouensis]GGA55962.1 hypothetical protein GCM10007416_31440 [Kroppenstedtia guangzhouensis]